jgi:methylphosphotriester-DNA--protein-cysteine methyltransferase
MKKLTQFALIALLAVSSLAGCSQQTTASPQQAKGAYVASANAAPFHRVTCRWANRISPQNLQTFEAREQAIKTGHRPCKVCRP